MEFGFLAKSRLLLKTIQKISNVPLILFKLYKILLNPLSYQLVSCYNGTTKNR